MPRNPSKARLMAITVSTLKSRGRAPIASCFMAGCWDAAVTTTMGPDENVPASLRQPRRERAPGSGDAEVTAPDLAAADQRSDDRRGGAVDGHRQAETHPGDRGVHAHHVAPPVGKRPTGVARVE